MNKPQLGFNAFEDEWEEKKLGEIVTEFNNQVDIPEEGYTRLGIRSHAKGTFHEYVPKGHALTAAQMSEVKANNLIMSITFAWEHAVAITDKGDEGKLVSQRFPQFSFNKGHVPLFYKYIIADESFRHHLWLSSPGGAGRNRVLNIKEALEYKTSVPNAECEQQKIGTFLSQIDSLIQAKKQKLESLKSVKKSLLQKCFPKDGEKVPQMRFEGFSGNWEEIQFSDCFDLLTNNTLSRDELNFSGGTVKSVHYGDVLIKFPEITDVCIEKIAYITDEDVAKKYSKCLLRNGDIIIADTAEDETVGKCSEIQNCSEKVVSGLHTIPVRPKIEFAKKYLGFFMNSESFHNQLLPLIQGTKVSSISKSAIEDVIVRYPVDLKEQEKIGQVFSKYNELIKLQEMEVENLKTIKKSLLQKMFA